MGRPRRSKLIRADIVRKHMEEMGVTAADIGQQLGYSMTTVRTYLAKGEMPPEMIHGVADILDIEERNITGYAVNKGWNKAKKRPLKPGRYMITTEGGGIDIAYFDGKEWWGDSDLIAWRKLPEAYKA